MVLADTPSSCEALLKFAETPFVRRFDSFAQWFDVVGGQSARTTMKLVFAAVENPEWTAQSFPFWPPTLPCASQFDATNARWENSPLAAAGVDREDAYYIQVRLSVENDNELFIETRQDFDCDGVVSRATMRGTFRRGYVLGGGWKLLESTAGPPFE